MGNPKNPCDYFKGKTYGADKKLYNEYLQHIQELTPQERQKQLPIISATLEGIRDAFTLPLQGAMLIGAVVTILISMGNNIVSQWFFLLYFTVTTIFFLCISTNIGQKKVRYHLYQSLLSVAVAKDNETTGSAFTRSPEPNAPAPVLQTEPESSYE